MDPGRVEEVLSALLFQNAFCSFKMTSEAQTIFLSLKSPGTVNIAAHWRDFETFDLGAEVNQRLKEREGKPFVEAILRKRALFYPGQLKTIILLSPNLTKSLRRFQTIITTSCCLL